MRSDDERRQTGHSWLPGFLAAVWMMLCFGLPGWAQPVQPTVSDFDDGTQQGWMAAGTTSTTPQVRLGGPSGAPDDLYLHLEDSTAGGVPALSLSAPADFLGDYSELARRGGALEFDVRVFDDFFGGRLTPTVILNGSTPGGPSARFRVRGLLLDRRSGWQHVVVPFALLAAGDRLPADDLGAWEMIQGEAADWNQLLSDVRSLSFPLDFVAGSERIGFDNIRLTVPCANPPSGLVAWWPFNDRPGDPQTRDIAGGHDVQLGNGARRDDGFVGTAMAFDGQNDFATGPDAPTLDFGAAPGGDFTIDFWIRTTQSGSLGVVLEKRNLTLSQDVGYQIFLFRGNVGLQLADGSSTSSSATTCSSDPATSSCTNYVSDAFVADGEWHFVAVTVDRDNSSGGRWYLDGEPVGSSFNPTIRSGSLANSGTVELGRSVLPGGPGFHFSGRLDEVEVFRRALDGDEIRRLFEGGAQGKCTLGLNVPWDRPLCLNQSSTTAEIRICNHQPLEIRYRLEFAGLTPESCELGGNEPGPTRFTLESPAQQPILVPADSCRDVTVRIGRPPNLEDTEVACYRVTARRLIDGAVVTDQGSVQSNNKWCCDPVTTWTQVPFAGELESTVLFEVTNTGDATDLLEYEIGPMGEAAGLVRLDGGGPGSPVSGEVLVDPGETRTIRADVGLTDLQAFEFADLLLQDRSVPGQAGVLASAGVSSVVPGCNAGDTTLCLNQERFRVQVAWRDFQGGSGVGNAVPLTSDTGYFWFFDDANVELILKVLDARPINGNFWVFYGALSNVEYTITVTDTVTGRSKTYDNPARQFASVGDTEAFPGNPGTGDANLDSGALAGLQKADLLQLEAVELQVGPQAFDGVAPIAPFGAAGSTGSSCVRDATSLCLNQNRFRVEVEWVDFQGGSGSGTAVLLTTDTGYFWFFDDANVELVTKVIDGRPVNGSFWFFYGALSNVEYTLTVTDTVTGTTRTYENPTGRFGSVGDTEAFSP